MWGLCNATSLRRSLKEQHVQMMHASVCNIVQCMHACTNKASSAESAMSSARACYEESCTN